MIETKSVSLDPAESQQVSFEVLPEEARAYSVAVNGLVGSFEAILAMTVLLSGSIMNKEGNPIPWSDVFIYPPPYPVGGQIRVKADGQGYYTADLGLITGEYHIVAAAIGALRYEIGQQWVTLDYGENVVNFYLALY